MFKDKVALITGGASGLGRVLVEEFLDGDARVAFTYRSSTDKARELEQRYGDRVLSLEADASDYDAAFDVVKKTVERFGRLDILVNNAASARDSTLLRIGKDAFEYTMKNVLYPVYNYSKAAAEVFAAQSSGKIINIGSINGIRGREGSLAYSTAKGGVEAFTKTIAKELGKYNVNCNVVAPGYIDTDGQAGTSELIKELVLDECAIRKLTLPIEIANLVLFLSGDRSNNITGQVYRIDCGQYI